MRMASYQQQAYRKIQVETANPGRILLTLYDAVIRFVRLARNQIEAGDTAGKGVSLNRAYAIIAEFINALDFERAPELCQNLEQIYTYMLDQLSHANLNMDPQPLEHVLRFLVDLRETWEQAVTKAAAQTSRLSQDTRDSIKVISR